MRTLATQLRLRRALRAEAELHRRLVGDDQLGLDARRAASRAASARLLQLVRDVRSAWAAEAGGLTVDGLHGYVTRSMAAMAAAAAGLERPGADLLRLSAEFRDAGLPLVFFLRGLDDSEDPLLAELVRHSEPLARSA
jgi:hypothetical protein